MKLNKQEIDFIKINEIMIETILNKRINDLKDELLEVPDEKRNKVIEFLKEYKIGLGMLKELTKEDDKPLDTGI